MGGHEGRLPVQTREAKARLRNTALRIKRAK